MVAALSYVNENPWTAANADVAGVADFLRGIFAVVAAVVVERLDQGRARRHRVLAAQRIIGEADQIVRAVDHPLRHQMRHLLGAALDITLDQDQPRAHHLLAVLLHDLRPHHDVGDAGLVLQRHEHHALGAARPLPHQHHAGAADAALVVAMADVLAGHDAFFRKHRSQKFHRVAL